MVGPVHYAVAVVFSLLALAGGIAAGLETPKKAAPWILGACVLAAVLRAVLMVRPDWETRVFPWAFYAFYRGHWVYPMGIFILAFGGTRLPVKWNRVLVWLFSGLLCAWSLWLGSWMLRKPCPGSRDIPARGLMTMQSTLYTCAPAVCANLLRSWGIEKSEHEMAQLCLCTRGKGTNVFDTYRGLLLATQGTELKVRVVRVARKDLPRLVKPFAVLPYEHALLILDVRGDALVVADPLAEHPVERPTARTLEKGSTTVFLLCRQHPFDGQNAPHLGEWLKHARKPWTPGSNTSKQ